MMTDETVSEERKYRLVPVIIFLVAFGVRLYALLKTYPDQFYFTKYLILGEDLFRENFIAGRPFSYSPLYCYLIALCRAVFTRHLFALLFVQIAVGSLTCTLIYLTARRLYGNPWALISGIVACLYSSFILYDISLLSDFLGVFLHLLLLTVLIYTRDDQSPAIWMIPGIVVGLCILQRPNNLLLVPLLILLMIRNRSSMRQYLARVMVFAGSAVIVISPVMVQNYALTGEPGITASNPGYIFYSSNNTNCYGFRYNPPSHFIQARKYYETVSKSGAWDVSDFAGDAEIGTRITSIIDGSKMSLKASSVYYFRESMRYISNYPMEGLTLLLRKCRLIVGGYEPHDVLPVLVRRATMDGMTFVSYFWLAPLGIIGFFLSLKNRKQWLEAYVILLNQSVMLVLFYIVVRFRLSIEAMSIIFAGLVLKEMVFRITSKQWRPVLWLSGALVLLFPLCNIMDARMQQQAADQELDDQFQMARYTYERGNIPKAMVFLESIVNGQPDHSPRYAAACRHLAQIYHELGRNEDALRVNAHSLYDAGKEIQVLKDVLKNRKATAKKLERLAFLQAGQKDMNAALATRNRALTVKPSDPVNRYHLARLQMTLAQDAEARKNLSLAVRDGLLFTRFGLPACFYLAQMEEKQDHDSRSGKYYVQAARQAAFEKWYPPDAGFAAIVNQLREKGWLKNGAQN